MVFTFIDNPTPVPSCMLVPLNEEYVGYENCPWVRAGALFEEMAMEILEKRQPSFSFSRNSFFVELFAKTTIMKNAMEAYGGGLTQFERDQERYLGPQLACEKLAGTIYGFFLSLNQVGGKEQPIDWHTRYYLYVPECSLVK